MVIGIGTRWSDFTTASKSAFQDPGVRFVNVNVAAFDAAKHSGPAVVADARVALEAAARARSPATAPTPPGSGGRARRRRRSATEVARLVAPRDGALPHQAAVIGAVNDAAGETGVVVCAAGSMPGDLHKLWRARDPRGKGYHVEYGYSCMGYEIPGGMGVKLAAPEREVYVMVGDGSYLMMPGRARHGGRGGHQDRRRARRQPRLRVDRRALALARRRRLRHPLPAAANGRPVLDADGRHRRRAAAVDLAANAESLGLRVMRARGDRRAARRRWTQARAADGPVAVHIEVDRYEGVPAYEGWWDVPVAEVADDPAVRAAREEYERGPARAAAPTWRRHERTARSSVAPRGPTATARSCA